MSVAGFVYDERMLKHRCPYDDSVAESPNRIKNIYDRLTADELLNGCIHIPTRMATDQEIELCHPKELIESLQQLRTQTDHEEHCKSRDLLYLCSDSLEAAQLAAGGTIEAMKAVVNEKCANAFAIVRPPGHHSHGNLPQGYCIFNNVAIAAKVAVDKLGLQRVLIVDFDFHPPNGTYYSVHNDSRIVLASLHNYMHGAAWPHTEDMDYTAPGNAVHIPLNRVGFTGRDYLAAFHHIILPIAKEWNPQLILVSAGFDSALGDMGAVSQAVEAPTYGHIVSLLNEIAPGKVCAVLEGGYFPPSYTECAAMTMRGIRGQPLPAVRYQYKPLNPVMVETIWHCLVHLSVKWDCIKGHLEALQEAQRRASLPEFVPRTPSIFLGKEMRAHFDQVIARKKCRTREWMPQRSAEETAAIVAAINQYVDQYEYKTEQVIEKYEERLDELRWCQVVSSEAFIQSAQSTLMFYQRFKTYINSTDGKLLIGDRENF
uniref:Histone deacetylase domain-containing protein n=1 Tax=Plectus sambesii TaxID=2011161 RepID=A0A914VYY8_9BILA